MDEDVKNLGSIFHRIIEILKGKLGVLSLLNLSLILALVLFVVVDAASDFIIWLIKYVPSAIGYYMFKITPIEFVSDTTPFWHYAVFLLVGLLVCLWIVKLHEDKKLWP